MKWESCRENWDLKCEFHCCVKIFRCFFKDVNCTCFFPWKSMLHFGFQFFFLTVLFEFKWVFFGVFFGFWVSVEGVLYLIFFCVKKWWVMISSQFQNNCEIHCLVVNALLPKIEVLIWCSNQCEGKEILVLYRMELNRKNDCQWKT